MEDRCYEKKWEKQYWKRAADHDRVICVCNGGFDNDRSLCKGTEAEKNDGYTLDFNSLENDLSDKVEEIGQSRKEQGRTEASDVSESTAGSLQQIR